MFFNNIYCCKFICVSCIVFFCITFCYMCCFIILLLLFNTGLLNVVLCQHVVNFFLVLLIRCWLHFLLHPSPYHFDCFFILISCRRRRRRESVCFARGEVAFMLLYLFVNVTSGGFFWFGYCNISPV